MPGYLTVWTPQVQIVHPGALPDAPQASAALRDKWQARFAQDAAYNNNLALTGKGFTLGERLQCELGAVARISLADR